MKTNQFLNITLFIAFAVSFVSCEKEIKIKHNSKESKLVIEAEFDGGKQVNSVKISKTVGITNDNVFPYVSGAKVTITGSDGYFEELQESEAGTYQSNLFNGKPGTNYTLRVFQDGKTYEAQSTMPACVTLDTFLLAPTQLANMKVTSLLPVFRDPAGIKNYYSFVRYLNGTKLKGTILMSDELSDGKNNMQIIFSSDETLKNGDRFGLELRSIDKSAHVYLSTKMQTANQNSAAPANPLSNFSGGALGYFSTYNSQTKEATITDWTE